MGHTPDPLLQLVARLHAPALGGQHLQQAELGARQLGVPAVEKCLVQRRVDHQARHLNPLVDGRGARHVRPPDGRVHPRHELVHSERLGQVVVAADPERVDLVLLRGSRADHDHRDLDVVRPERLDHPPAVHARQHQIDHRDIRSLEPDLADRPVAAVGPFDVHPGMSQMRGHRIGDHAVVLGDQDARHDALLPSRICADR
jgi:hypothetical protein